MSLSSGSEASDRSLRIMLAAPNSICAGEDLALPAQGGALAVVGRADSESAAMRMYLRLRPDVIVLDWRLSVDEPARLIGMLTRIVPDARIISVVPGHESMPARAARALCADLVVTEAELPAALAGMAAQVYPGRLGAELTAAAA